MNPAVADVVTAALRSLPPETRGRFLRDLLTCAAAGLTSVEGERAAAEAVYRLGDSMIGRPTWPN